MTRAKKETLKEYLLVVTELSTDVFELQLEFKCDFPKETNWLTYLRRAQKNIMKLKHEMEEKRS